MLDFVSIEVLPRKTKLEVKPEFKVKKSKDLMTRGKNFYAVWNDDTGLWSKNEDDVTIMIDREINRVASEIDDKSIIEKKLMSNFSSNQWLDWQKYVKSLPDNYKELDDHIVFANTDIKKKDYVTRTLDYPLVNEPTPAYDELMDTLYDESERTKLEWAVGAIISGDSKKLQKFVVLYGGPGTGKSTVLNIIQMLFKGYYSSFDSKALTRVNNSFALEAFKTNPLVAIEHDGDLSKIEDNTRLNSIVSHEEMTINEKFKSTYTSRFNSFLFMGTNKPVRITDAKSGIIRRLIDVQPSGRKVPRKRFEYLMNQIQFELGGIANHCLERYKDLGFSYYDNYIPVNMLGATNDMFNFCEENYDFFMAESDNGIALTAVWARYQEYCNDAKVPYPLQKRLFKDELKNYFKVFKERSGARRSVYYGFKSDKFFNEESCEVAEPGSSSWLKFDKGVSLLDEELKECQAQYATADGIPTYNWDKCWTKLKDINSKEIHYVMPPDNMIVIDFDIKDENGDKSYEKNLEAALQFPPTYAELSKSKSGVHLHYWYTGDVSRLSRLFGPDVEIKVFTGKSSLRRMLTKCNDLPIAEISSGLPLREEKKVVTSETIQSERGLRELIRRNLRKEIHPGTKPSMDFIAKILDDAYNQGLKYDVRDMRPSIQNFAMNSTHQADYCLRLLSKMKFASEEPSLDVEYSDDVPIVFFDVEVFPNVFIIVYKQQGEGKPFVKLINPSAEDVEALTKFKLVGFNNRKYDNHILYAAMMGYTPEQLFKLSQRIVVEQDRDAFFGEAYNLSYTDIYDFLSASNKMSLKKWEIKLGIHHQEFAWPWDKPLPKEKWKEAADYCTNDVFATEAVWDANQADWEAREILSEWAGLTPNDTTNNCTTKLIVGNDKNPQSEFIYTDLSTIFPGYEYNPYGFPEDKYDEGVKIVKGKSYYMGKDPGEGGYAIGYPGIYSDVAVLDVASMHPHSAIRLKIFGERYTMNFENIVLARIYIKHKDYESAKTIIPERLHKYLDDPTKAKKLANALKTAINSVYGLTSASFPNKLKDPRNVDNIVAKYGALFMMTLEKEVKKKGYQVVHIKTDSIKIANADNEIIEFVKEFGKEYGFTFEHESTYSKICLVNDAVYIAKYLNPERCEQLYGYVPEENKEHGNEWTATGTQFQVPYVFKTLFSKEEIDLADLCETKSVTSAMYLDYNESLKDDEHDYRFVGRVGLFCPVKDGNGGGILLREDSKVPGKFGAVNLTKRKSGEPYRWLEAETVVGLPNAMDIIDRTYYDKLANDAIDEISKYGDFEMFINDDYEWMRIPDNVSEEEGIPFDECINHPLAA